MACSFFLAFFCFIPIIAIAYAIATRKGASEDDIRSLPKYRYRFASSLSSKNSVEKQNSVNSTIDELTLHPDYSVSIFLYPSLLLFHILKFLFPIYQFNLPC